LLPVFFLYPAHSGVKDVICNFSSLFSFGFLALGGSLSYVGYLVDAGSFAHDGFLHYDGYFQNSDFKNQMARLRVRVTFFPSARFLALGFLPSGARLFYLVFFPSSARTISFVYLDLGLALIHWFSFSLATRSPMTGFITMTARLSL
jgi:hypothetical protein